jgi:hypothetical protein
MLSFDVRRSSHFQVALPQIDPSQRDQVIRKRSYCLQLLKHLWSVSTLIILLLLLTVVATSATIWPTNYAFARKGVSEVARIARLNQLYAVENRIILFLAVGPRILNVSRDAYYVYEAQGGDPYNPTNIEYALALMSLVFFSEEAQSVQLGFDNGAFYGLLYETGAAPYSNGSGVLDYYSYNFETRDRGEKLYSVYNYNTTTRPWYTEVLKANKTTWTEPYINNQVPPSLVSGIGQPYYSLKYKRNIGVLFVGWKLNILGEFLNSLTNTNNTRIILLETSGQLIATSVGETDTNAEDNSIILADLDNYPDQVIRDSIHELKKRQLFNNSNVEQQEFQYDSEDGKRYILVKIIRNDNGIQWFLALNILSSDISGKVADANRVSAIISSVCIVTAFVFTLCFGCCLARPLRNVTYEMNRVSIMDIDEDVIKPGKKKKKKIRSYQLYELNDIISSLERLKRSIRDFSRYVPALVVKAILRSNIRNVLGVIPRDLTVLFCDIKDFNTVSNALTPHGIVQLLEKYFTMMSDVIVRNQGAVDKYIGSALMVCSSCDK